MTGPRLPVSRKLRCFLAVLTSVVMAILLLVAMETNWHPDWRALPKTRRRGKPTATGPPPPTLPHPLLPCGWTPDSLLQPKRRTAALRCSQYHFLNRHLNQSAILFQEVDADVTPSVTSLNDTSCLKQVIRDHCGQPVSRIPRVVHYVQFGNSTMTLEHFISLLSATRFIQPCLVLVHGDVMLSGPYWRAALSVVSNMVHVHYSRPTQIFGHKISHLEHSADVTRLRVLQEYGGIYLDRDQFVVRALDEFYNDSMVISKTIDGFNTGNGFLLAEPGAPFLRHWLHNYTDFNDKQWGEHSTIRPYRLSKDFPRLVRVIHSFFKPDYRHVRAFFSRKKTPSYDWSQQHGFHLYKRFVKDLMARQRLDRQDNVVGRSYDTFCTAIRTAVWRGVTEKRENRKYSETNKLSIHRTSLVTTLSILKTGPILPRVSGHCAPSR